MTESGMTLQTNGKDLAAQVAMIREFIDQKQIKISRVSNEVGYSSATISQVLSGKYGGDASKVVAGLQAWIAQVSKRRDPNRSGFVMTKVAQAIVAQLDMLSAISNPDRPANIVVIYGPAGCGKSLVQEMYVKANPNTIRCEVRVGDSSPRGFIHMICDELNIPHTTMLRAMMVPIRDQIKGSKRMIMIDEAHKLFDDQKNRFAVFETIRDIHDMTGCPIALFGTSLIVRLVDEGLREAKGFRTDQFKSRVRYWQDLTDVINSDGGGTKLLFSVDEIREIFKKYRLKLHPHAARYLAKLASIPGTGMLRTIGIIMDTCEYAFPDELIEMKHIKAVFAKMNPKDRDIILRLMADEETDSRQTAVG